MHAIGLTLALMAAVPVAPSGVWPGREWPAATPESQGMSSAGLDDAAAFSQKYAGSSGCVIRFGKLVKEWGPATTRTDVKSTAKGAFGTTVLGLALRDGLVSLEDKARAHYPKIGTEQADNDPAWLAEITVRELATMTAGFDDGRPPKLVYRPGTKGIYSNDTSNMLAELLTLRFREDLAAVVKREVMKPIGAADDEWAWRPNGYRPKTVGEWPSREFASGITITHRALARVGYLYLRDGRWGDKQILPREFVRAATRPTDLPAPYPYYGMYWGTNAKGQLRGVPKDVFWAHGLGDSMVVVCPSLDVVAVRLGAGSTKSSLPPFTTDWDQKVESFFRPVVNAVASPYPPSPVITGVTWSPPETVFTDAKDSDNWPLTWADDGHLYAAYGDGTGFAPKVPEKLSLGFARIEGGPDEPVGINVRSATGEQKGNGKTGKKASGLLAVGGVLYLWARNAGDSQLAWSADRGATWTWADWKFTGGFGHPTFLNFGRNYAGARDDFVYAYSPDRDTAYAPADRYVLARVPRDRVRDRAAYEFFREVGPDGSPVWTADVRQCGAAFSNPGKCYRGTVSYDAGLKRYLLCQAGKDADARAGFGIFDAPEPWGPWTTATYAPDWDTDPGEMASLPTKWMSEDGKTVHLVYSGGDRFNVRKATFVLGDR